MFAQSIVGVSIEEALDAAGGYRSITVFSDPSGNRIGFAEEQRLQAAIRLAARQIARHEPGEFVHENGDAVYF
jgi:hypothetical protein